MPTVSIFLEPDELKPLVEGKKTIPAQVRRLKAKNIPHEVSGRRILVSRAYIEKRLGNTDVQTREGYAPEPDFSHFDAPGVD